MSFRGRGRGRGRGGQQHERVDGREFQLVYENCSKREHDAADALYKGKWGVCLLELHIDTCSKVNNTDVPPDALQLYLDKLFTADPWQDAELIETKTQLNLTKDKMDDIPLEEWRRTSKQASRAQKLVMKLREQAVELATMSWCSMYEALCRFMLFPRLMQTAQGPQWQAVPGLQHLPHQALGDTEQPDRKACATVHLCEAPGAFIAAINHYKHHSAKFLDWDWKALTLSPYFVGNDTAEMLKDNALMVQTALNWHFGRDESGDIRKPDNIQGFWEHCSEWFQEQAVPGALLVTADGSIDTQENPNEQEAWMASLIYAQFVTAVGLLAVGGSLYLKCFATLEHQSLTLLYACGSLFDKVDVYKPVSSKVNNSEAYIVCRGFRGIAGNVRDNLLRFVCEDVYERHAMLPRSVMPASFFKSAKDCGKFFAERTKAAIEDTLAKREMHPGQLKAVRDIQDFVATQWMKKFRVTKLPAELRLSPDEFLSGKYNQVGNSTQMDFKGTLKERRMKYQDRREVQGQHSTRLIKRMREETGLENEDATAAPCSEKDVKASKASRRVGSKADGDAAAQHDASAGLAEGSKAQYALQPDTQRIENVENLDEGGAVVAPDSDEVQYAWDVCELPNLPRNILVSATLKPEIFLEVRKHRKRALEVLQQCSDGQALCPHMGSCVAPAAECLHSVAFWKIAALDLQLGIQHSSFSDAPALTPLFLRAMEDGGSASVLCLEAYGSSALQYVLQAHYAPHHKLNISSCYVLDTPATADATKALPGMLQRVALPGSQQLSGASSQEAKLAAFTAESSQHVCEVAKDVDVVIGDLGGLQADIPQAQQLSIWPEYNRVARRRLVWDSATALGACKPGGSLLLRIGDVLTSFTVGLLYVLFRNFRLFTILKPFSSCSATSEAFALFLDRAAPLEAAEAEDSEAEEPATSAKHLINVLERMQDAEAPGTETEGADGEGTVPRPGGKLLVGRHISDILKPDVYLSGDKAFVAYVNSRINDLVKRQAHMLDNLASRDTHEAPTSDEAQQVQLAAVRVLFGDGSPEATAEAQAAVSTQEQPQVSLQDSDVSNSLANGKSEHGREGHRPPAGDLDHPAADLCGAAAVQQEAADDTGAQEVPEAPAQEPSPAGVRRKRSVAAHDAEDSGKRRLKRESQGARHPSGAPTAQNGQRSTAVSQTTAEGGVDAGLAEAICKLQESWGRMLCGVAVDSQKDVFIAWSKHIQDCDEQEVQQGDDDSPA